VKVELLWWRGCPSYPEAADLLRRVIADRGLDVAVESREVVTEAEAAALGFPGSPTIRIDGLDVDPVSGGDHPSLSCRLYRLEDGRASPVPSRAMIEEALADDAR
jgi:hypothetical protein